MKYLSNNVEKPQTALFEKTGSFFAFSPKQFNEAKKEGVKYVSLGLGMICPKETVDELLDGLKAISKAGIKQDLAENGREGVIKRELANHECYYTCAIGDCVDALADYDIDSDEIQRIYSKERLLQTI